MLGAGLGLVLGSLAMWRTDPTAATAGTTSGLLLCLIVAFSTRTRKSHDDRAQAPDASPPRGPP